MIAVQSECGRYRARVAPSDNGSVVTLMRITDRGRVIDRQYVAAWHVIRRIEYPMPLHCALDLAHHLVNRKE